MNHVPGGTATRPPPASAHFSIACANAFVRLFSGAGGVNAYPIAVSSLWQDLTGRGVFAGKGIYDVAAFHGRLDGALPEGRILSHDILEGAGLRTAFAGESEITESFPSRPDPWFARMDRSWTTLISPAWWIPMRTRPTSACACG